MTNLRTIAEKTVGAVVGFITKPPEVQPYKCKICGKYNEDPRARVRASAKSAMTRWTRRRTLKKLIHPAKKCPYVHLVEHSVTELFSRVAFALH